MTAARPVGRPALESVKQETSMNPSKLFTLTLIVTLLSACSGLEYEVWPSDRFAAGSYQTYSWRSEPNQSTTVSADPIYMMDPIVRAETDKALVAKGYTKIARGGDFTIDYIYAPGLTLGVMGEDASIISPRIGIRPNNQVSQAQRDNAIALGSGVKTTHNLALQVNDGRSNREVWRGVATQLSQDEYPGTRSDAQRSVSKAVGNMVSKLPTAP